MRPSPRPSSVAKTDFGADVPDRLVTALSATIITANSSGGPSFTACSTRIVAKIIRPIVASVPATNEPMALVASAAPARPRFAIS